MCKVFSETMALFPPASKSRAPVWSHRCTRNLRCSIWVNTSDWILNTRSMCLPCLVPSYRLQRKMNFLLESMLAYPIWIHCNLCCRLISQKVCILPTFAALWSLYFSLIQVADVFGNQCDQLLLEAGFFMLLLAPLNFTKRSSPSDRIALVLIRWLLFR